ncbi:hypothetical protein Syun_006490 [Stephania yunnanensis]|uniref:NAC domain-containing protein n=1 Tax=Stephania yunnanensis TaxID=152371 RepID=A0AAP0PZC9_9MAGN
MEKLNFDIRKAWLVLVEELIRNNHLDDANMVSLKGAKGGLRATDEIYDLLIEEDCKAGDHSNALTIAYEMEAAGRMATTFHFNHLLSVQATCGIPEIAFATFEKMEYGEEFIDSFWFFREYMINCDSGDYMKPDTNTYNWVIQAYTRAESYDRDHMDYLNQLPWGFTFNPTDEELISYLEAKSKNSTLPFVDPIIDFDVYTAQHPSQLHMQQRLNVSSTHLYFYVEKSGIGRIAGNGFWHANTGGTEVMNHLGEVIGYRTSLVYYMYDSPVNDEKKDKVIEKEDKKKGKSPSTKTNWIMNEFKLLSSKSKSRSSLKGPMWTICKIGETGRTFGASKDDQQQWQCDIDDLIGSVPQHQASDQIEQLEQYHPQFEEQQQHHDDQIFIDQYDHRRCIAIRATTSGNNAKSCDNVSVPQGDKIANQDHQLQHDLIMATALMMIKVDNLGLSEDDLRFLLEHSNALQQYDDDEDGIPEMLWLDEAQLACDEEALGSMWATCFQGSTLGRKDVASEQCAWYQEGHFVSNTIDIKERRFLGSALGIGMAKQLGQRPRRGGFFGKGKGDLAKDQVRDKATRVETVLPSGMIDVTFDVTYWWPRTT